MSRIAITAFNRMSADDLADLTASSVMLEPADGATLFTQADPADAVWAITGDDGSVRIVAVDRQSKALMGEVFRAGDIFGAIGVIDGGARRPADAAWRAPAGSIAARRPRRSSGGDDAPHQYDIE